MSSIAHLPWTITVGWVIVIAWSIGQFVFWHRLRVSPMAPPPPRRDPSKRRSTVKSSGRAEAPLADAPEFLPELGLHDPDVPLETTESVYR